MAHNNGIITAPVDCTTDVPVVLGIGTYDVGEQIARASVGGKSGYAFNIIENGGNGFNGELLAGAKPYWNVFSNESPGAWEQGTLNDGPLIFRLKPLAGDITKGYGYGLHHFDGYKHNSVGPEDNNLEIQVAVGSNRTQNVGIHYRTGEYDWRKINNANAAQFEVLGTNGSSGVSPVVALTAVNMTLVADLPVLLASTAAPHTEIFDMRLYIGRRVAVNDFNSFGYVPMSSTIKFEIYQPIPAASLVVYIGNLTSVFRIDKEFTETNTSYNFTGTKVNSTINILQMVLKKIVYKTVTASGAIGQTLTVTNFDIANEYPVDFESFSGNVQDFIISKKRLTTNINYPYLEAEMYFDKFL